ncbi:MAG: DUF1501 domain-containing protein [Planctomycetota bacterium]|nr:MAG: DUF1501 domain-containing protein [Planctomycetota bacterium]
MLTIWDPRAPRLCEHWPRRTFLQAGGLAALGLTPATTPARPTSSTPRARSCIVLFLLGGPPQHSTWDPKPQAPAEVRGEFGPIATTVPGVQICELLPRTARLMHRVALLRAVATDDNAHSSSGYAMLTGQPHVPRNRENANPGPPNDWPTMGAVVQALDRTPRLLPTSVRLPMHIFNTDQSVWPGQDAGWLGASADPWLFRCEPASPDFDVPEFRLQADVTLDRMQNRRSLLQQLETRLRHIERTAQVDAYSDRRRQAFDLLTSSRARAAIDLRREPENVRDRYGRGQFGQSVLLARRLVEAGVRFVQVNWFRGPDEPPANPCWDSHRDEPQRLKNVLVPPFDQAFSALLEDLDARGRLDETLVVAMAEFGRTPRLDRNAGRGHWGPVFSIALAGGGVRGGTVFGSSDRKGAYPQSGRVEPRDITATIFHLLGFEPETTIRDPLGRTFPISRGRVIREIL